MINPNRNVECLGKIISFEEFTSMVVYKIETKHGIFDYTAFGVVNPSLCIGMELNVNIGYSISLDAYSIKYVDHTNLKAA